MHQFLNDAKLYFRIFFIKSKNPIESIHRSIRSPSQKNIKENDRFTHFSVYFISMQDEGDSKVLKLRFDVSQYSPEEIVVKTVDQKLLVSLYISEQIKIDIINNNNNFFSSIRQFPNSGSRQTRREIGHQERLQRIQPWIPFAKGRKSRIDSIIAQQRWCINCWCTITKCIDIWRNIDSNRSLNYNGADDSSQSEHKIFLHFFKTTNFIAIEFFFFLFEFKTKENNKIGQIFIFDCKLQIFVRFYANPLMFLSFGDNKSIETIGNRKRKRRHSNLKQFIN